MLWFQWAKLQYYEELSSKARAKPRSPSRSSSNEEDLGQRVPILFLIHLWYQDRNYVTTKIHVLYPEFRGRMVSAFLCHHFSEVTEYSFTADMETQLDNVSAGLTEWKAFL
ncbi:hypothetical protein ACJW30_11G142800 [Castanea mollissima]